MPGRKTTQERIVLIESKIEKKKEEIRALEEQREKLLHPVTMRSVMSKAKESGLTPERIAEKLGIKV